MIHLIMFTDGGARGNPGPGAVGIVIKNDKGEVIMEIGRYIGKCTNNEAEYTALVEGLKICLDKGAVSVKCNLDSELVVKQLNGTYKVKNENMRSFWNMVKDLEKNFKEISYTHIERSKNKEADKLVNMSLDAINL